MTAESHSMDSSPDDDTLIFAISPHVVIRVVADCKDVRRKFANLLVLVLMNILCGVDRQHLVGINGDQYRPRVGLYRVS